MGPELVVTLVRPIHTGCLLSRTRATLATILALEPELNLDVMEMKDGKITSPSAFFWENFFILEFRPAIGRVHVRGLELKPGWPQVPREQIGCHVTIETPRAATLLERACAAAIAVVLARVGDRPIVDEEHEWVTETQSDVNLFLAKLTNKSDSLNLNFALDQFLSLLPESVQERRPSRFR